VKKLLSSNKVDENILQEIYFLIDLNALECIITYRDIYKVERVFPNNRIGLNEMDQLLYILSYPNAIVEYLGLKE
jgi:hypothetical protein